MTHSLSHTATIPSYDRLPIIDLSAADRGPQARTLLRAQLHSAAHDIGSFQLIGHGVPRAERDALLTAARAFFALPEADRLALDNINSPHFRGYTRTADERTRGARDRRDQFDIGPERPARTPGPGEPAYWWLEGPNQWPAALPELRTAALAWIDRLSGLARRLLHELLTAIGAPADFYDPVFGDHAHPRLKLVRRAGGADDGTHRSDGTHQGVAAHQGVGVHKDRGFLTLVLHDTADGLRAHRRDGRLPDVPDLPDAPPLDGAFVVTLGELLEAATDGYLIAPGHGATSHQATSHQATSHRATGPRVVAPRGATERFCVPFFHNPRLDARVAPLPFPYADAAPGITDGPDNPLHAGYGHNELKGMLRAHPRAARRHHGNLLTPA
ncbi:isopenicillin N synthase family dioxygenase [Streptomyces sp. NPDC004752]